MGGPKEVGSPHDLNHIRGMLARYKNVLTNRLLKKNVTTKEWKATFAHREIEFLSYVVMNEVGGWT